MRESRFIEEQIIAILAEQERGVPTVDARREHGLSTATFYKFKAKYGGMGITDARKLELLEIENGRLCVSMVQRAPRSTFLISTTPVAL